MKVPSVVIGLTKSDEVRVYLSTMDKAAALAEAKEQASAPDEDVVEIRLIVGVGAGIAYRRPIRKPSVVVEASPEPAPEPAKIEKAKK